MYVDSRSADNLQGRRETTLTRDYHDDSTCEGVKSYQRVGIRDKHIMCYLKLQHLMLEGKCHMHPQLQHLMLEGRATCVAHR